MWSLVVLTGFSYEEMYGRFAGTKKSGGNEVVVRWGSTVLSYSQFSLSYALGKLSRKSIICRSRRLATEKSRYFAQPCPLIVDYVWIGILLWIWTLKFFTLNIKQLKYPTVKKWLKYREKFPQGSRHGCGNGHDSFISELFRSNVVHFGGC